MNDDDKLALFHVLNDQRLGLEHLGNIMKKDGRDVGIVLDELSKASSSSSSGNKVKHCREQQFLEYANYHARTTWIAPIVCMNIITQISIN